MRYNNPVYGWPNDQVLLHIWASWLQRLHWSLFLAILPYLKTGSICCLLRFWLSFECMHTIWGLPDYTIGGAKEHSYNFKNAHFWYTGHDFCLSDYLGGYGTILNKLSNRPYLC